MSDQFVGEIRMFAGSFAPNQWALCDGQLLPISQNTALFSLLGTYYGGNGQTTFALPDLRGCSPIGWGAGPGLSQVDLGEVLGTETVTLVGNQIPSHTHQVSATSATGTTGNPSAAMWAVSQQGRAKENLYGPPASLVAMDAAAVGAVGGGQPHNNLAPYLVVNFIIALQGIFPPRG
jgi:microcystin-dependent protein